MKREILCPDCGQESRKLFPTDEPYPGEFVKFVPGTALLNYLCDLCGKEINKRDDCIAFTIWTKSRPYSEWEFQYIKMKDKEESI